MAWLLHAVVVTMVTHLVHLVDSDGKLRDSEGSDQKAVLAGLPTCLEPGLKLPTAGIYYQDGNICLPFTHKHTLEWRHITLQASASSTRQTLYVHVYF